MTFRVFNMLTFERQDIDSVSGHLHETVTMQAFVPGVNSGVYDKALVVSLISVRPFKFWPWLKWKFGTKQVVSSKIVLNVNEMTRLRDEINQILRLPFNDDLKGDTGKP